MNTNKILEIFFLLTGLGYIIAAIVWLIIGNVDDKFFTRFFVGLFSLSIYLISRKLK